MTQHDGIIYWGTNNNYLCMPGYGKVATSGREDGPYENSCWVCEYEQGARGKEVGVYGDIQAPRIFRYDTRTGFVEDITPNDTLLGYCQGLRSAATKDGVVFFGGPSIKGGSNVASGSSCFLAYSLKDRKFIGSSDMASIEGYQSTNIRRWIIVDDVLYCGVGLQDKDKNLLGGVLRWRGSEADPFNFEIVGYVASEAAEIEYHNGRIYAGTWPNTTTPGSIFCSPVIPEGGLTKANATKWDKVWDYTQYEVDPASAKISYFSVMRSYKGRLYFGMFSNTYAAVFATMSKFGSLESADALLNLFGSLRSTTLFSTTDFSDVRIEYGEKQLPYCKPGTNEWTIIDNASSYEPHFGRSGYGNIFACYTWAMCELNDHLYIGTMDMSDLIDPALSDLYIGKNDKSNGIQASKIIRLLFGSTAATDGYELLRLDDTEEPVKVVTDNGFGNPAAYGIRNMIVTPDNNLLVGTANPLNLHEQGGWQILEVKEPTEGVADIATDVKAGEIYVEQTESFVRFSTFSGADIVSATLFDVAGNAVASAQGNGSEAVVVTYGVTPGIYVAKVVTANGIHTSKIRVGK
ncbi:MAG: T9SS type A sorting domain-containing protein [Muribaculaceae bacterium]|nr:T9SS type A sorting domain-containing protein [Muribaculaceae bacterium]